MKSLRIIFLTIFIMLLTSVSVYAQSGIEAADITEAATSLDGDESPTTGGHAIIYHLNGGVNNPANPVSYEPGKKTPLKKATREGYSFAGWHVDKELNNKIKAISPMASTDINLYAKWKPKSFSIKYVVKTGLVKKVKKNKLNPKKYTPDIGVEGFYAPVAVGYSFRGWYKDPEFTSLCENIPAETLGKMKLYAKWTEGKLKISFDLNGADGEAPGIVECDSSEEVSLPYPSVKVEGKKFYGWNTKPDGTGLEYVGNVQGLYSTGVDNTMTLYAQWIDNDAVQDKMAEEIVKLVNQARKSAGVAPLNTHPALVVAANVRAEEISVLQDHVRPNGKGGLSAIEEAGYKGSSFAENIGWGYEDASHVMEAWLASKAGHRDNILSAVYTDIGVGCYEKDGVWYFVQCFGKP